jgi:hypothetical protein
VHWIRLRQDPVVKVHVGDDLGSLLDQKIPSKFIKRISLLIERQSSSSKPSSELMVIDSRLSLSYGDREESKRFETPNGRYLELGVIASKIHSIVFAPQVRYLDLDGAFLLLSQVYEDALRFGWREGQRFCQFGEIREMIARESGYFYSRYVELKKGQQTLSLILKRLERPFLIPRRKPSYGFIVNMSWNDALLEASLRELMRSSRVVFPTPKKKPLVIEASGPPPEYAGAGVGTGTSPDDSMIVAEPIFVETQAKLEESTAPIVMASRKDG